MWVMQGSFVVVFDLLFLVPTYFLLVGFINAEFWLVAALVLCRMFWGKSVLWLAFLACWSICIVFWVKFHFWEFKICFIDLKRGAFCENLVLVAFETFDILFWHLWGEKFDILCKADHPSFTTCMYMRRRTVSIFAAIV